MTSRDDGRAFGRGKIILLGEHAVVYGVPALAAGIGRGVWARAGLADATRADATRLAITPWNIEVRPDGDGDLSRALAALLDAHPSGAVPPLSIEVEVELPAGAGLGCSAALGVAVLRAIDAAVGHAPSDAEVAERSLAWERVFHGNPSGIDNTVAAHGGIVMFTRGAPLETVTPKRPLRIVIGDSAESASTKAMVSEVRRQHDRDPARFQKTLDAIAALVQNARLAIEAGDLDDLGQLMNLDHTLLNTLMLSTAALEEMCAAARHAGAKGAKLTGSGGGGCMIALVEDDEIAERVREAIEATGHRAFTAEAGR
jgi:mevalonate kinase